MARTITKPKPAPIANSNAQGLYQGKELKRNPGIDEARFAAFHLPSRMGSQLIYPKRTP